MGCGLLTLCTLRFWEFMCHSLLAQPDFLHHEPSQSLSAHAMTPLVVSVSGLRPHTRDYMSTCHLVTIDYRYTVNVNQRREV